MEIASADSRVVELTNYFNDAGGEARVLMSPDGYLNEVLLANAKDGTLTARYGPDAELASGIRSMIFLRR